MEVRVPCDQPRLAFYVIPRTRKNGYGHHTSISDKCAVLAAVLPVIPGVKRVGCISPSLQCILPSRGVETHGLLLGSYIVWSCTCLLASANLSIDPTQDTKPFQFHLYWHLEFLCYALSNHRKIQKMFYFNRPEAWRSRELEICTAFQVTIDPTAELQVSLWYCMAQHCAQ